MKKRLLPYLFFLSIACFPTFVLAIPVKSFQEKNHKLVFSVSKIEVNRNFLIADDHQGKKDTDTTFHYTHGLTILGASITYYKSETGFCLPVIRYDHEAIINVKEVERILKDHLLHLFPYHYFW